MEGLSGLSELSVISWVYTIGGVSVKWGSTVLAITYSYSRLIIETTHANGASLVPGLLLIFLQGRNLGLNGAFRAVIIRACETCKAHM